MVRKGKTFVGSVSIKQLITMYNVRHKSVKNIFRYWLRRYNPGENRTIVKCVSYGDQNTCIICEIRVIFVSSMDLNPFTLYDVQSNMASEIAH